MTVDDETILLNESPRSLPSIGSMFYLNIFKLFTDSLSKYNGSEIIFLTLTVLSIAGIPLFLIPYLVNDHLFDVLIFIHRNKRGYCLLPFFVLLYPIAVVYHYLCILSYPFLLMLRRNT